MAKRTGHAPKTRGARQAPRVVEVDEIILDGAPVQVRNRLLPLDSVLLDPTNPRVAYTVRLGDFGTGKQLQTELENLLWKDRDVRQGLYQGILDNGGLIERIIVRQSGVVAEGNCRTVVYRKLHAAYPVDERWLMIPARVLPADITEKQIAKLLGEMHVGGKNKWSAFEKAAHIHKLVNEHGIIQDEIAKLLRTSKTTVNVNLHAFEAMRVYLKKFGGEGATSKFSYFLELYKKPELRAWVASDSDALRVFSEWVANDKIERGEHVRELKDFVTNPRALAAFKDQGREAARKVLQLDRPELTSALFKAISDTAEALEQATVDDIQQVRKDKTGGGAKRIVRKLQESFERFLDLCGGID